MRVPAHLRRPPGLLGRELAYWREHGLPPQDPPANLVERVEALRRPTLKRWQTVRDAIADQPPRLPARRIIREKASLVMDHDPDMPALTITSSKWNNKRLPLRFDEGRGFARSDARAWSPGWGDGQFRYFTIPELARLQAFPDEWPFAAVTTT